MMGKMICSDEVNISRYREWAVRNYGDSGKTKTVTKRKYERIMKVLRGKERYAGSASSENGKFRFWVRGKGFKLGKPLGYPVVGIGDEVLLVPVKTTTADGAIIDKGYKQVAVVEDFYDIIYNVHVQTEGKEGKHAGQKRTYRAVAEKFAFLPREAVTRFLMSCKDCKTRMQLTFESSDKPKEKPVETGNREPEADVPDIRYSLPITTTYLSHLRNLQYMSENEDLLSEASGETDMTDPSVTSDTRSMGSVEAAAVPSYEAPLDLKKGEGRASASPVSRSPGKESSSPSPPKVQKGSNGISFPGMIHSEPNKDTPEDLSVSKDEDDEDDGDDDSEKANETAPAGVDPERLKSFNMFVRLFVDENLDRIVPISKQPKEKIQAIIEACYRQFPEFHERARKRIRTYLKSCRRMKRQRDQNGIDSSTIRPTPPHLTSARAEQILAAACESESENARRMRMELLQQQQQQQLQPHVQQPIVAAATGTTAVTVTSQAESQPDRTTVTTQATPPTRPFEETITKQSTRTVGYHFENGVSASHDPYYVTPQLPTNTQPTTQHTPMTNGPTDLSVKKLSSSKAQLSPTEIANIRQLITSYRESAAFLYRSADELEQMLLQLN